MTTAICVRISEEDKRRLRKYGKLSSAVREGVKLYHNKKKTEELLRKLEELQTNNPIKTSIEEEVKLIREDRNR